MSSLTKSRSGCSAFDFTKTLQSDYFRLTFSSILKIDLLARENCRLSSLGNARRSRVLRRVRERSAMMNLGITGKAKEYIKQRLSALKIMGGIALNEAIQANDARSNALQWHHGDKSTRDHASRHNQ